MKQQALIILSLALVLIGFQNCGTQMEFQTIKPKFTAKTDPVGSNPDELVRYLPLGNDNGAPITSEIQVPVPNSVPSNVPSNDPVASAPNPPEEPQVMPPTPSNSNNEGNDNNSASAGDNNQDLGSSTTPPLAQADIIDLVDNDPFNNDNANSTNSDSSSDDENEGGNLQARSGNSEDDDVDNEDEDEDFESEDEDEDEDEEHHNGHGRGRNKGNRHYVCVLNGPGSSSHFAISTAPTNRSNHSPSSTSTSVCMSDTACEQIVGRYFPEATAHRDSRCDNLENNPGLVYLNENEVYELLEDQ